MHASQERVNVEDFIFYIIISFLIIVIPLGLTEKNNVLEIFTHFLNIEGDIGWVQR